MRSPSLVVAAAMLAFAAGSARAQCPDVSFQPYGQGCNPSGSDVPVLSGAQDGGACAISLFWNGLPICCNPPVTGRFLILGLDPAAISVAPPGAGCTLLVQPLLLVPLPPDSISITAIVPLNPLPAVVKIHVQIVFAYNSLGTLTTYDYSNALVILMQ